MPRAAARRLGTAAPVASSPDEVATRQRWGLVGLGVVVVSASVLGFSALYRSAGDREPVLVVARDVERFEPIEQDDLRVALVAAEPGVGTVPESDLDDVVGRVALTGLAQGSILAPNQLAGKDDQFVGPEEAVVGARLESGAAPVGDLSPGTRVLVVIRPGGADGSLGVREVPAWLAEMSEQHPNNGVREASIVVSQESAGVVAAAAAEQRIAVVALEGV